MRLTVSTLILSLILLLAMGNKNGRASSANRGNTGAPGDELSLGQPKTCINCHNQGPISASLAISVLDADNQPVTQYQPGQEYNAQVKITATGSGLVGHGFQMIALRDAGNTDLDGFSDTNPNNYKIATISNGRTYAEHDNISVSNTFNVKWTAPGAGTGSVTFYAAGNGVNANGGTGGDGSGFSSLKLTEIGTASAGEPIKALVPMAVSPSPMLENAFLKIGQAASGDYRLRAFDNTAKMVWENQLWLPETGATVELPTATWSPGVYYLQLEGAGGASIVKAVKL
jgi:Reeler domain